MDEQRVVDALLTPFTPRCESQKGGRIVASRHGEIQGEDTLAGMIAARINANRSSSKEGKDD